MIVVRIELHSAITGQVAQLGAMTIANDGTGTNEQCDYDGWIWRKPDFKSVTRHARLIGHRRHALTIWHLVARMLNNMGYVK